MFTPADEPRLARGARQSRGPAAAEWAVAGHVAGLLVFTAWDFGGETDLARVVIAWWGVVALLITVATCVRRISRHDRLPSALLWLWPLAAFDLLVLAGALNPSFTLASVGGVDARVLGGAKPWWPSSAVPGAALRALWQLNAIYLSCFNLALVIVHRRLLRALLFAMTANALVLAVFGTFQKLAHAPGLYFGSQRSPNPTFFATFIYHNHWGAFLVLVHGGRPRPAGRVRRPETRRRGEAFPGPVRAGRGPGAGGGGAAQRLALVRASRLPAPGRRVRALAGAASRAAPGDRPILRWSRPPPGFWRSASRSPASTCSAARSSSSAPRTRAARSSRCASRATGATASSCTPTPCAWPGGRSGSAGASAPIPPSSRSSISRCLSNAGFRSTRRRIPTGCRCWPKAGSSEPCCSALTGVLPLRSLRGLGRLDVLSAYLLAGCGLDRAVRARGVPVRQSRGPRGVLGVPVHRGALSEAHRGRVR